MAVETVDSSIGPKPVILATLADQVVAGEDPAAASHRQPARRLFAARGYVATTMSAIAKEAGVDRAGRGARSADIARRPRPAIFTLRD